jgi:hypothetical protein
MLKGGMQQKTEPACVEPFHRDRLFELLSNNQLLWEILDRSHKLSVPNWAVGAGFIQQTVFNVLHGRPSLENIKDIDWVYFDSSDLSEEAENRVIQKVSSEFRDIELPLDIKNQARVHLWYSHKFGYSIPAYRDLIDAISTWPTTSTAIALTKNDSGTELIAPFGLSDLLSMIVRANRRQITELIYEQKLARWCQLWPKIRVLPWSEGTNP